MAVAAVLISLPAAALASLWIALVEGGSMASASAAYASVGSATMLVVMAALVLATRPGV